MGQIFAESLYDAILDCLKVAPVLFLAYLLVSALSHDHSHKFSKFLAKNKKTSVLYASFLGCVPQCGFSSVIADLYSEKRVSIGSLVAVFVATSDEAIPIMLSHSNKILDMIILIGIKIVLAIFWGYLIDLSLSMFKNKKHKSLHHHAHKVGCRNINHKQNLKQNSSALKSCQNEIHCAENNVELRSNQTQTHKHECGHIHTEKCDSACGHNHGDCCVDNVFLDAFMHSLNIILYIFIATVLINVVVGYFGTETLENLLTNNIYLQVLIASLIGLIPNCASSVLLVELFIYGSLGFPALVAGLSAGAGVGLFILFTKNRKQPIKNLAIVLLQYIIGVVSGMLLTLFF